MGLLLFWEVRLRWFLGVGLLDGFGFFCLVEMVLGGSLEVVFLDGFRFFLVWFRLF